MRLSWMILGVCLFGCEGSYVKHIRNEIDKTTIRSSFYLKTVVHDEHLFILTRSEFILHHPDCPCHKNILAEKPPAPNINLSPEIFLNRKNLLNP